MAAFADLPPDAQLHDLASLSAIDAKQVNPEQLGADAIKEQQEANLKYSSGACAVIPEDQAQTMLAGVSAPLRIRMCKIPSTARNSHSNANSTHP